MSGYRQSRYDPEAYAQPGRPMRPYNWVQWSGVVLLTVGLAANIVYLAGAFGWIAPLLEDTSPANILLLVGIGLIHSRRGPETPVEAEQHRKNRKVLLITITLCAIIIGAATIIELTGAL